jgi:UDP-N-acetylglucosamine 4,6-dehydratase
MIDDIFKGKKIFITGMGTIGTEILKQVLNYDIHSVRVFDNSEIKLHYIKQLYKNNKKIKIIFGDIRDRERLKIAMRGVNIVFHTAAMKHVSICECNPIDSIKTNVFGTQNIIDISIEEGVEKIINISTDKATDPIGVMGATKLLSERLISAAEHYLSKSNTSLFSVRFGNVLGSSGSVITIFEDQIKSGGPVTITNPKMTRFMMSISDAIKLIFKTIEISKEGEIFILKMPSVRIMDLAEIIIEKLSKTPIDINIIGNEKEEKMHERLISDNEIELGLENDEMIVICPTKLIQYYVDIGFISMKTSLVSSDNPISKEELRKLIEEYYATKD